LQNQPDKPRFLIAPDKLKGSLSASDAAECIAAGIRLAIPNARIDLCPIADGGEGTVDAILKSRGGRLITRRVTGPLPEIKVDASFALLADNTTAVIEMSAASGLALLPMEDRNPLNTTTFGTGELIAAAIKEGARKIILGLGGSATIDAGIGMAQACGFTILTKDSGPTSNTEPLCGRDISNVLMVKQGRGEITNGIEIIGLVDVNNPLCGPTGAPKIFGAQKGATPAIIDQLDAELHNLATRTGKQVEAATHGAGSAGGLGFGILAFLNGSIRSGFDFIAEIVELKRRLSQADFCFTAEGRLDNQTRHGKTIAGVAALCREMLVPCVALAGSIDPNLPNIPGLTAHFSICDGPITTEQSVARVKSLITKTAHNCTQLWAAGSIRGGS
jgi:glycerate kinase